MQEDFATLHQVMIVHCGLHLMTTAAMSACGNNLGGVVKCNNVSKETYLLGCFCMSYDSTGLECGSDLGGIVKCNYESRETYLLQCFCMSYDTTGLVVGALYHHT